MGKPGVDGKNTKTNHIVEVSQFYDVDKRQQLFKKHFGVLLINGLTALHNHL